MSNYAIAAMAENRVIGKDNGMPWHLPDDFKWFKKKTMGSTLVMGRKTFESIGKPLPGRDTIVLSRSVKSIPNVQICESLQTLNDLNVSGDIYFCGGAEVYEQTLPLCSDLFLTLVKQSPEGDAYFPEFEDKFELKETLEDNEDFSIQHYCLKK
jgi:dihydrofolate reductase